MEWKNMDHLESTIHDILTYYTCGSRVLHMLSFNDRVEQILCIKYPITWFSILTC